MTCSGVMCRGGTGQQPYQFGAISGSVPYASEIKLCEPMPGIPFQEIDDPLMGNCGIYTRNLDNYPLNQATIYQNGIWTFGLSEMVLAYVRFDNYPRSGGYVKLNFINPQGQVFFTFTQNMPIPDPSWDWWYATAWGVVGKFDKNSGFSGDEIITPGNYRVEVITSWGGIAVLDFDVTGSAVCVPNYACEQPLNGWMTDGCGDRWIDSSCAPPPPVCVPTWHCEYPWTGYENDGCGTRRENLIMCPNPNPPPPVINMITINIGKVGNGTGKVLSSGGDNVLAERTSITVPYGYKVYFYAEPGQDSEFVRWVDGSYSVTDNPLEIPIIENGSINAEFKLKTASASCCPRGEKYQLEQLEWLCDPGYNRDLFGLGSNCVCQKEAFTKPDGTCGEYEGSPRGEYMQYLIYGGILLIGLEIVRTFRGR